MNNLNLDPGKKTMGSKETVLQAHDKSSTTKNGSVREDIDIADILKLHEGNNKFVLEQLDLPLNKDVEVEDDIKSVYDDSIHPESPVQQDFPNLVVPNSSDSNMHSISHVSPSEEVSSAMPDHNNKSSSLQKDSISNDKEDDSQQHQNAEISKHSQVNPIVQQDLDIIAKFWAATDRNAQQNDTDQSLKSKEISKDNCNSKIMLKNSFKL